jgi:c-di-GMP-binding flagellar brake protein YcgR
MKPHERPAIDPMAAGPAELLPGSPVLLEAEGAHGSQVHSTTVIEVVGASEIRVRAPDAGHVLRSGLADGQAVRISAEWPHGIETYSSRVLRHESEPEQALVLEWPTQVQRLNRRDAVRVHMRIPVDLTFSTESDPAVQVVAGLTADVSETGMRLVVPRPIPAGTVLSVRLHLGELARQLCGGEVMRCDSPRVPGGAAVHWVAVRFENMSTSLRGRLRRCLWDVQRDLCRRGLR